MFRLGIFPCINPCELRAPAQVRHTMLAVGLIAQQLQCHIVTTAVGTASDDMLVRCSDCVLGIATVATSSLMMPEPLTRPTQQLVKSVGKVFTGFYGTLKDFEGLEQAAIKHFKLDAVIRIGRSQDQCVYSCFKVPANLSRFPVDAVSRFIANSVAVKALKEQKAAVPVDTGRKKLI